MSQQKRARSIARGSGVVTVAHIPIYMIKVKLDAVSLRVGGALVGARAAPWVSAGAEFPALAVHGGASACWTVPRTRAVDRRAQSTSEGAHGAQ